jgi:hypothetical protein
MSAAPFLVTDSKTQQQPSVAAADKKISRQIDLLERISREERDRCNGSNATQDMREFFTLEYAPTSTALSFRPRVILPELQYLAMSEATDLTNDSPKFYVSVNGKRDEPREKAMESAWRAGCFNNRIFDAVLWSQFSNPSWLQVGFNSDAREGKGSVWLSSREPDTVDPDPRASDDRTWSFVKTDDWYYLDEIRRMYPEKGQLVRAGGGYDQPYEETEGSRAGLGWELPEGSLRIDPPDGFENSHQGARLRVRRLWIKDYAKEAVRELAGNVTAQGMDLVVEPILKYKYPGGRFITECNGIILADGPNFVPRLPEENFGSFPVCRLQSFPTLNRMYGPPPVRYGRSSQENAEMMYRQLIENMIRTNNAQYWIPKESEIDIDAFGGLPGEVQVYSGDKPPTLTWPSPIPQHMTQIPDLLLAKVQRYQGFTQERQGQAGQGNISPDLFDAAVFQSQTLNRMKARFLSETIGRVAQLTFYMMARFKNIEDQYKPSFSKSRPACVWTPLPHDAVCELQLDDASVQALSTNALQKIAMALAKTPAALGLKDLYDILRMPNADELADAATKQQELAAVARTKRPR